MKKPNTHSGSNFDDFLKEEGFFEACLSGLLPIMLSGESTHRCRVSRR